MFGPFGVLAASLLAGYVAQDPKRPDIDYYRLAPGFVAEAKNDIGMVTGFSKPSQWGQYTAYLLTTNAKGQRSWRIEHYVPRVGYWQGSSIYLFEGSQRALLIDTGNPAEEVEGVNDLKTVVKHLLAHEDDGTTRARPLDFVVANTHSHGDHIGENARMSDRTVFYMDGDWPKDAPANYVPIREGGGATEHGKGTAVSEIELGDRTIKAVAIPPHTPGSTGYLDAENRLLVTGDAMGSGYPWLHWAKLAIYARSMDHVEKVTRDMPDIAILPAHFSQVAALERLRPPINGRPLDRDYILDQRMSAYGIIDGTIEGEPYYIVGGSAAWGGTGTARIVYSMGNVDEEGSVAATNYRSIRLPAKPLRPPTAGPLTKMSDVQVQFHQIRSASGVMLQLVIGSRAALLIGTGKGEPGLGAFVARLTGSRPLEVVLMSDDRAQTGGIAQLKPARIYAPTGVAAGRKASRIKNGSVIDLGTDAAGRPLRLEAATLAGRRGGLTLIDPVNRLLFAGDALGTQRADAGLALDAGPAAYKAALATWRAKTDGRYDFIFTAGNEQWILTAAYVDRLAEALDRAASGNSSFAVPSQLKPGWQNIKSDGPPAEIASVAMPAK